jgi:uncharacterized Ntn-hydrolase superfamily protein
VRQNTIQTKSLIAALSLLLLVVAAGGGQVRDIPPEDPFIANTFSIVAFDPDKKEWGVAVASRVPAVGAAVPWTKAGIGAVATQSATNLSFGPNGLEMLAQGKSAEEVVKALTDADNGRDNRQLGIVDTKGNVAAFTGKKCSAWAGHKLGMNYACQGNLLAGEAVIESMAKAFEETKGPLTWRLMAALDAGDKAGGDKRGKQSAAIQVVKDKTGNAMADYRHYVDFRVDDHKAPVEELARLVALRVKKPKDE